MDLLEGLDSPPVTSGRVRVESRQESTLAHDAWALWVRLTQRSDHSRPPSAFVHAYTSSLRAGRSPELLTTLVQGAARLPVKANNVDDTRRVIGALTSDHIAKTALGAFEAGAPVIPYPHGVAGSVLTPIADIATLCRANIGSWSERDQDAAGILSTTARPEDIEAAIDRVALRTGADCVLPVEILSELKSSARGRHASAKPVAGRRTYAAGTIERERVSEVDFSVDDLAEEMLMRGRTPKEIERVHRMAPAGYWEAVFQLALEGFSNDAAYERLRDRFGGFHAKDRDASAS